MIGQNNIFNIRHSKLNRWVGQISSTRGFCDFADVNSCIRAMCIILNTYRNKHGIDTIEGIVSRFAPPAENDTKSYITFVSLKSKIPYSRRLVSVSDYVLVIIAMAYFETNFTTDDYFLELFNHSVDRYIKL